MQPHVVLAFAAVGRAVWLCQIFETALAPIYELFKMNVRPGYLEKTGGYLPESVYKNPLKNIINELSNQGHIDNSIKMRLEKYVEDRHLLIHRWFVQNGWPDDDFVEGWKALELHAMATAREAQELTRYFTGYLAKHAEPTAAKNNPDEYALRITAMFRDSAES